MIALYERAVSFYGSLVNVNAYHQPGVEAGKKAATAVLELQKEVVKALAEAKQPLSLSDLANQIGEADQIETIYKIVRHLSANHRSVQISGDLSQAEQLGDRRSVVSEPKKLLTPRSPDSRKIRGSVPHNGQSGFFLSLALCLILSTSRSSGISISPSIKARLRETIGCRG